MTQTGYVALFIVAALMFILLLYIIKLLKDLMEKVEDRKAEAGGIQAWRDDSCDSVEVIDEEIIAAISAAVAEVMERPTEGIRIRSIKRIDRGGGPWVEAGRWDAANSRMYGGRV